MVQTALALAGGPFQIADSTPTVMFSQDSDQWIATHVNNYRKGSILRLSSQHLLLSICLQRKIAGLGSPNDCDARQKAHYHPSNQEANFLRRTLLQVYDKHELANETCTRTQSAPTWTAIPWIWKRRCSSRSCFLTIWRNLQIEANDCCEAWGAPTVQVDNDEWGLWNGHLYDS